MGFLKFFFYLFAIGDVGDSPQIPEPCSVCTPLSTIAFPMTHFIVPPGDRSGIPIRKAEPFVPPGAIGSRPFPYPQGGACLPMLLHMPRKAIDR